ncbi:hypothetical protein [Telmatospirillum sp. J64-1]|uniref:hypothetical protein n=1 Tax=Telmatospirillum sp. J64-1 TaxID=2502183 RepID=UPI00115DFAF0|nr:hypothetical protein [Telmatospirillum sp. J64-1]
MTWSAYGANYALPASIHDDLDAGRNVVAMVSRTVVEEARNKFSSVEVILVTTSRPLRRRRLAARGEALDLIVTRLDRDALPVAADHRLQTDGGIEAALPRLMSILREGRFSQPTGRRRSMLTGMAAANLR